MAHATEVMDGDKLPANEVIAECITSMIAQMYIYAQMLPADRKNEKEIVESWRNELCIIRGAAEKHLKS